MTATQKNAWFSLAVILVSLIAVGCLYPFIGWKANGALGLCGLLGFGPLFYRKRSSEVVMDERDLLIEKRAALIGYSVFWVVYVLLASLFAPMVFGKAGSIPVLVVQWSVFYALILFLGVKSLATLVQYTKG